MSGRRSLEAMARVQPWALTADAAEEVDLLLRHAEGVADEQVDEWIDLFPLAFLEAIDRRRRSAAEAGPFRRRFADRLISAPNRHVPWQSG